MPEPPGHRRVRDSVGEEGTPRRKGMRSAACLFGILALLCVADPRLAPAQSTCARMTVGVDTSLANSQDVLFHGDAIGQTFVAPETLITSITVWRPASVETS